MAAVKVKVKVTPKNRAKQRTATARTMRRSGVGGRGTKQAARGSYSH